MTSLADPIPLQPNPVARFYRGGGRLAAFRAPAGYPLPQDACEDWVGSSTRTWQLPGAAATDDGLSRLADGSILRELAVAHPRQLVGIDGLPPGSTGVLVKLLDAGERLPIHCHPSRDFARRHLASPFGKAEAWIILDAWTVKGEEPRLWLGWRDGMTAARLRELITQQRTKELLEAMAVVPARPGEVWLMPPGVPHAIGAGVFMVEVQEPADFSVVAEWRGFPIRPDEASLGRGWDLMADAFDLEPMTPDRLAALHRISRPATPTAASLLHDAAESWFRAFSLRVDDEVRWPLAAVYSVVVVAAGSGWVRGATTRLTLEAGMTFAVPAAAAAALRMGGDGLQLVICQPGAEPPPLPESP